MRQWRLDLGDLPWERLQAGIAGGHITCGGGTQRQVLVRYRGAHSRRFPKKSLQVDFRPDSLPDDPPAGHSVGRVHLNADYVDLTLMRSPLSFALFEQMQVPAPMCRHTVLTMGTEFAGLYLAIESVDADFCRRRGWPAGPIYYALNRNANFGLISPFTRETKAPLNRGYKSVGQSDTASLCQMITAINLAEERHFPSVAERWFNVEGYLRWLAVAVFVANRDGFLHNYALYREPSGRFCIIPWDYDATWGVDIHGRPARLDRVPVTGWNQLTQRLLSVRRYREQYRTLFQTALEGPLSPDAIRPMVVEMWDQIEPWVVKDRQRWEREASISTDPMAMVRWAEDRRALLRQSLKDL